MNHACQAHTEVRSPGVEAMGLKRESTAAAALLLFGLCTRPQPTEVFPAAHDVLRRSHRTSTGLIALTCSLHSIGDSI